MELLPIFRNKVSVRNFTDEELTQEQIQLILEAGQRAPSAKNRQPWRFIAINRKDIIARIKEAAFGQNHVGEAPLIIALCTTNIDYRMPNGELAHPIDIAFAASYMSIQAEQMGLGSCVVSTYDIVELKELLTIPYSMQIPLLLLVGHAASKDIPNTRKPLKSISSYNHW